MPVGVIVNVIAVFIGTIIGGTIKHILPKHLMDELPKVFGICSFTIGLMSVISVKTLPMVIMAVIIGFSIGELTHINEHVSHLFSMALKKLPFHIEGNHDEYMEVYLLVVLMFSMSGTGIFGALSEGMSGDSFVLISKSVLDFFYCYFVWCSTRVCSATYMCTTIYYFNFVFFISHSLLFLLLLLQ